MTPIEQLAHDVSRCTLAYRKEVEVVKVEEVGPIRVVHINDYPEVPASYGDLVDVHFLKIGFTEAAADQEWFESSLYQAIADHGVFADISREDWRGGPSYISVGGWIGSQDLALRLFALIKHYGLGDLITPAELHVTDPETADALAGRGMVMCTLRHQEPLPVGAPVLTKGGGDAVIESIDAEDAASSDGRTYTLRSGDFRQGSLRRQSFRVPAPAAATSG